jgi:DNA-directed RNA polymerase specialized sigma24 family protein
MGGSASHAPKWALTKESLESFLLRLDANRESAGEIYEQIRRKLVTFFQGRGLLGGEDLADETLDRVIRKLGDAEVLNLTGFILGVARHIASERHKHADHTVPLAQAPEPSNSLSTWDDVEERTATLRAHCLERCLQLLENDQRELIVEWYLYDKREKIENKRRLADKRKISLETLRVQANRARQKLQRLVDECIKAASSQ